MLQYYKQTYDIEIKNSKQPLVMVVGSKKEEKDQRIVLIPELLMMSGLPDNFD